MSRRWKIQSALLLSGVCLAAGVLVWQLRGPSGPARILLGEWEIVDTGTQEAVQSAVEKKDPEVAPAVGDGFRTVARIRFYRNGSYRDVSNIAGLTITNDGTWQVVASDDKELRIQLHWKKQSVANEKGQSEEKDKNEIIDWVATLVGSDHLSMTATIDGKDRKFALKRAKD